MGDKYCEGSVVSGPVVISAVIDQLPSPLLLVIYFKYPCSLSAVAAELDQKLQAWDKEVDSENLTDGLTGRRIATGSENSPRDMSRFGAEVIPAPSPVPRVYMCAWGQWMMDEGSVDGSQLLAPLIYPHVRLEVEGEELRRALSAERDANIQYFFPPFVKPVAIFLHR